MWFWKKLPAYHAKDHRGNHPRKRMEKKSCRICGVQFTGAGKLCSSCADFIAMQRAQESQEK